MRPFSFHSVFRLNYKTYLYYISPNRFANCAKLEFGKTCLDGMNRYRHCL